VLINCITISFFPLFFQTGVVSWLVKALGSLLTLREVGFLMHYTRPPPPPFELCPAPFLGLTVQPCGERCGSPAGFDFLTVEVI